MSCALGVRVGSDRCCVTYAAAAAASRHRLDDCSAEGMAEARNDAMCFNVHRPAGAESSVACANAEAQGVVQQRSRSDWIERSFCDSSVNRNDGGASCAMIWLWSNSSSSSLSLRCTESNGSNEGQFIVSIEVEEMQLNQVSLCLRG